MSKRTYKAVDFHRVDWTPIKQPVGWVERSETQHPRHVWNEAAIPAIGNRPISFSPLALVPARLLPGAAPGAGVVAAAAGQGEQEEGAEERRAREAAAAAGVRSGVARGPHGRCSS